MLKTTLKLLIIKFKIVFKQRLIRSENKPFEIIE